MKTGIGGLFIMLLCTCSAQAAGGFGAGIKAGTLGGSVELNASLSDYLALRGNFNYLTYSFDSTISDINYDFESDFSSVGLLLDWHPFGGAFFLSGGAYINNNEIDAAGTIDRAMIPGSYAGYASLADMVSVTGTVTFQSVAPYGGIGWRGDIGESGWGLALDLGILFQGEPDVENLRINAPVDVNDFPEVRQFLNDQEREIEDDLSEFQYYPVVSLMLFYTF